MIYFKLLLVFLKIGIFSFGGGYAMLPLIEKEIISKNSWINYHSFIDVIATSQITPGPIAINSATFIGYRIAGFLGSTLSTMGVVFFPSILILILAKYMLDCNQSKPVQALFEGLRPALVGMIFASAFSVGKTAIFDITTLFIVIFVLYLINKAKIDPIKILLISGVIGFVIYK